MKNWPKHRLKKIILLALMVSVLLGAWWFTPAVWRLQSGPIEVTQWHRSRGEVQVQVGPGTKSWVNIGIISKHVLHAILVAEDGSITYSPVPKGKLVNSIGAGDSMVAGFLTGYIETNSYEKAFYMGVATGSASAFSENLATRSEVEALLKTLNN